MREKVNKLQKLLSDGWRKTELEMGRFCIYEKENKRKVYDTLNDRVVVTYKKR